MIPYQLLVVRGGNEWDMRQESIPVEELRSPGKCKLTREHFNRWRKSGALWYIAVYPYDVKIAAPKDYPTYDQLMQALRNMGVIIHSLYWTPRKRKGET